MKAQASIWVVIIFVGVILIGLFTFTINQGPGITAYVTIDVPEIANGSCYELINGELIPEPNVVGCCTALKSARGCKSYDSNDLEGNLYECESEPIMVANKAMIDSCMN